MCGACGQYGTDSIQMIYQRGCISGPTILAHIRARTKALAVLLPSINLAIELPRSSYAAPAVPVQPDLGHNPLAQA